MTQSHSSNIMTSPRERERETDVPVHTPNQSMQPIIPYMYYMMCIIKIHNLRNKSTYYTTPNYVRILRLCSAIIRKPLPIINQGYFVTILLQINVKLSFCRNKISWFGENSHIRHFNSADAKIGALLIWNYDCYTKSCYPPQLTRYLLSVLINAKTKRHRKIFVQITYAMKTSLKTALKISLVNFFIQKAENSLKIPMVQRKTMYQN